MVVCTFNPTFRRQRELEPCEFQISDCYIVRPYLKSNCVCVCVRADLPLCMYTTCILVSAEPRKEYWNLWN